MREGERQRRRPEGFFFRLTMIVDIAKQNSPLLLSRFFSALSNVPPRPVSRPQIVAPREGEVESENIKRERERALSSPPPRERERMRCCRTTRFPVSLPSCLGSASLPETFLFYRRGLFQSIGSSREKREEEKKKVERRNEGHVRGLVDFSRQRAKRKKE